MEIEMARPGSEKETEMTYALASMRWSGWGSPVGLGFFVMSIGVFLVCLHLAGIIG